MSAKLEVEVTSWDERERIARESRDEDVSAIADLQLQHGAHISALRWRQPNLNDVFLWVAEGKAG